MERRTFLKCITHALGALWAALLGIPAVAYVIDARNRPAAIGDFRAVGRLSDLEKDVPKLVVIRDVRRDAWTLHPNDVIGRVWLIRRDNDRVDAFTATCPHLGCSVNFEDRSKLFICPCHNGTFDLDGRRVERPGVTNPAPRGMDHLECRRDASNPEVLQVKYQNFYQGKDAPVVRA